MSSDWQGLIVEGTRLLKTLHCVKGQSCIDLVIILEPSLCADMCGRRESESEGLCERGCAENRQMNKCVAINVLHKQDSQVSK